MAEEVVVVEQKVAKISKHVVKKTLKWILVSLTTFLWRDR